MLLALAQTANIASPQTQIETVLEYQRTGNKALISTSRTTALTSPPTRSSGSAHESKSTCKRIAASLRLAVVPFGLSSNPLPV